MSDLSNNVVSVMLCTNTAWGASYEATVTNDQKPVMEPGKIIPTSFKRIVITDVTDVFMCQGEFKKDDEIEFSVNFEDGSKKSYIGQVLQVRDKSLKIIVKGTQDIQLIIKKIGELENGIKS